MIFSRHLIKIRTSFKVIALEKPNRLIESKAAPQKKLTLVSILNYFCFTQ